ncbi:MAG: TDP-N-acetylfucosamine:lipid II N-acetylfucosaminyltransferase [Flavobacteriaceae bacterium]|nr:TDP-N-acetylfucosamine:lipid II N-acetylfucosaminyltransferase [Flavobacteriaceae bacterium]
MKKVLHLCNDDKFIPLGKIIFDSLPEIENIFWVLPQKEEFQFIPFSAVNLANVNINSDETIAEINKFDLLCIHFLNPKWYPLLSSGKIKIPILWIGWGGDYYWMIDIHSNFDLFLPKTFKKAVKYPAFLNPFVKKLKKLKHSNKFKTLHQIQYFSPTFEEEFHLIKSSFPEWKAVYTPWNYGYINDSLIEKYSQLKCHGNKILIGNSATPTNNHLDIFHRLGHILSNYSLVLPLNYGNDAYKKTVIDQAKSTFPQVEILDQFFAVNDFDKILMQCQNLIIGSIRQQAVGTIITSMYMGANVFIFKDSMNYAFFKNHGFHLFSIEELEANPNLLNQRMNEQQLQQNRQKINELWSIKRNAEQISRLLKYIDTNP